MATREISSDRSSFDAAIAPQDADLLDIPVNGMTCGACATRLQKALTRAPGIHAADVNFATERARVKFDASQTGVDAIAAAVGRAGFEVPEERYSFGVSGMTCSACATRIEKALRRVPGGRLGKRQPCIGTGGCNNRCRPSAEESPGRGGCKSWLSGGTEI